MKKLDQRSPAKCSIESGSYTFQYVSFLPMDHLILFGLIMQRGISS